MSKAKQRRAPKPTEQVVQAEPLFKARIQAMTDEINAMTLKRDEAIEMGAVAMGLTPEKGQPKWSYDVPRGAFHRAKRPQ